MTQSQDFEIPLVNRLISLAKRQDRGALAALRSGLGKQPGEAARMLPLVAPFLSRDSGPSVEAAFLVASLFGSHPEHENGVSLGSALHRAVHVKKKHGEEGVERRLTAAIDADPEDLPRHLEGLISLLESAGVPLDWHQLYRDARSLLGDNEEARNRTRTRWARHFWAGPQNFQETTE